MVVGGDEGVGGRSSDKGEVGLDDGDYDATTIGGGHDGERYDSDDDSWYGTSDPITAALIDTVSSSAYYPTLTANSTIDIGSIASSTIHMVSTASSTSGVNVNMSHRVKKMHR